MVPLPELSGGLDGIGKDEIVLDAEEAAVVELVMTASLG
jgi:hypothetical protein